MGNEFSKRTAELRRELDRLVLEIIRVRRSIQKANSDAALLRAEREQERFRERRASPPRRPPRSR